MATPIRVLLRYNYYRTTLYKGYLFYNSDLGFDIVRTATFFKVDEERLKYSGQSYVRRTYVLFIDMPVVQFTDAGGCPITFLEHDGILHAKFGEEAVSGISSMETRPDDVFICAYPKSGTHWVWEIVRFILAESVDLDNIEKAEGFLELYDNGKFDQLPSPRTLNTHVPFSELPSDIIEKGCKVIFLSRNPKDVAVSFFHHHRALTEVFHYHGSWENYFPLFMEGKVESGVWFDYIKQWEHVLASTPQLKALVLFYEDMIENSEKEIKKIAEFLNKDITDGFIAKVKDKCSFSTMKKNKGDQTVDNDGKPVFYRKGKVGDWKNWFTVAQNEEFDKIYTMKMESSTFKFRFTLQ